ncbi:methyl jasmonate esterase 1-like [Cornus florida]|uniref:methyl jasmonate esterase 1-like n=1 Tax=Cornus florida TaxID=4283 RepID=UPI002899E4AD|nr:methyl jasmonate esterase 1-like [Cornus florida]
MLLQDYCSASTVGVLWWKSPVAVDGAIDEAFFVLDVESHEHGTAPSALVTIETMPSIPFFIFLVAVFLLNPKCILECRAGAIRLERPMERELEGTRKHFVLVHGSNLGAWSWYKLITLLKSAGHNVTALDLAANGRDPRRLDEVASFFEYTQPLTDFMASLPNGEKVVLIGHSYGGYSISLAMERFPEKIPVAVFLTALMPNYKDPPINLQEAYFNATSSDSLLDSTIVYDSNHQPVSVLFGPKYIVAKVYNDSPTADQELAITLVRPTGFYLNDLKKSLLTQNKYGSVTRVFIISGDDQVVPVDFQKYMIKNNPPKEVMSIAGSDHMVMTSKPVELYHTLQQIADKYD